jgi:hypothetical protein
VELANSITPYLTGRHWLGSPGLEPGSRGHERIQRHPGRLRTANPEPRTWP